MTILKGALKFDGQDQFQQISGREKLGYLRSHDENSGPLIKRTWTKKGARKSFRIEKKELNEGNNEHPKDWPYKFLYHLRTLWLFTQSDLKSMIYPNIIFSLACIVSKADLAPDHNGHLIDILSQIPYVFVWLWLNLLLFNLANQRLPSSIMEDAINKPWRPIPSGRMDAKQVNILIFTMIPVVLIISTALGAAKPALALMALTWAYNDLGGANKSYITRNLLNAFGMSIYSAGAIIVASGSRSGLTVTATQWIAFIGLVVLTTIHVQDMKDQQGDAVCGRKTLPLVMGDSFARWTIAWAIMGWSLAAPTFWRLGLEGYVPTVVIGATITFRILRLRCLAADKTTWAFWCVWMVSLYLLPLW